MSRPCLSAQENPQGLEGLASEALEFRALRVLPLREQQSGLPGGSEIDSLLGATVTAHLSLPRANEAGVMRAKVGQKRPETEGGGQRQRKGVRDRGRGSETDGKGQREGGESEREGSGRNREGGDQRQGRGQRQMIEVRDRGRRSGTEGRCQTQRGDQGQKAVYTGLALLPWPQDVQVGDIWAQEIQDSNFLSDDFFLSDTLHLLTSWETEVQRKPFDLCWAGAESGPRRPVPTAASCHEDNSGG